MCQIDGEEEYSQGDGCQGLEGQSDVESGAVVQTVIISTLITMSSIDSWQRELRKDRKDHSLHEDTFRNNDEKVRFYTGLP